MAPFLEWLLDLEQIRLGRDAPLMLKWVSNVPAWMLLCVALAAGTCVAMAYRFERGSAARRIGLAALRLALVALVVAVICQPELVLQRNRVEPSYTAIVLDTSLSMAEREPYADRALAASVARGAGIADTADLANHSRLELIQKALTREDAAALKRLLQRNVLQLSTFSWSVETQGVAGSQEALDLFVEQIEAVGAEGGGTNLPGAIEQVIKNAAGRRLAAIVLATDGQSTEPISLKPALDLARDRKIPIYPLRVGSPRRVVDIELGPLRAQESVFLHDLLVVEVPLSAYGLTGPASVTVRLVEEDGAVGAGSRTLASQQVVLDPAGAAGARIPSRTVELRTRPTRAGAVRYRVEVEPLPGERVTANNVDRVDVSVLDDQLRVLYVDGYPRYEYRYLKNALLREETVELSVLLLEADEEFVQEGTVPIRRFPLTLGELNRYDVVLFGDVSLRSGWLTQAQMKMLLEFVGDRGGGFGLIAGERAAPQQFLQTPLEKLVPVRIDPEFLGHYETTLVTGFRPTLTPEGRRSRFFRLSPEETSKGPKVQRSKNPKVETSKRQSGSPSDTPFEQLPDLYWVARTLGVRPGATVLAEHPTARTPGSRHTGPEPMPIVVIGRYGAGKVFFQATDDTWRWRRHRVGGLPAGALFHDTYWAQVVRMLAQPQRVSKDRRYTIRTDRRRYAYGKGVRTLVEVFDSKLLSEQRDIITITVTGFGQPPVGQAFQPVVRPTGKSVPKPAGPAAADDRQDADRSGSAAFVAGHFNVHRLGPESNRFEGTYVPPRTGRFSLHTDDMAPPPGERAVSVLFRVERPDLEARRPEANHEVLERIADATGGRVFDLDRLDSEFARIEDRSVRIPDDITEPLWDSKLVLLLFVLMISMEWVLRKAFGML